MPLFLRFAYVAGAETQVVLRLRFGIAAISLIAIMRIRREFWPKVWVTGLVGDGGGWLCRASIQLFFRFEVRQCIIDHVASGLYGPVCDALSGSPIDFACGLVAVLSYSIYVAVGTKLTPQAGAVTSARLIMLSGALTFTLMVVV